MSVGSNPFYVELESPREVIDRLQKQVARLKDLRRWRPMSEAPKAPVVLCCPVGKTSLIGTVAYDLEEQFWEYPRHAEETRWNWTYIPGQEPKENP